MCSDGLRNIPKCFFIDNKACRLTVRSDTKPQFARALCSFNLSYAIEVFVFERISLSSSKVVIRGRKRYMTLPIGLSITLFSSPLE